MKSKTTRSFNNLISAVFKGLVTSLLGFVLTPFIITYVGNESFGLYKIMIDWLSNVWIFDLGVSGAFLTVAAVHFKKENRLNLFQDGFNKYLKALPLLFTSCIGFYVLTRFIITLNEVSTYEYTLSFLIISLTFLFYPFNAFRQYFEVSERTSFINFVTVFQLLLTNVFAFIFSYMGLGLIGLALSYSIFIALGFLIIYFRCAKEEGWNLSSLMKKNGRFERLIAQDGRSFLLINISQKISFLADNSIIAYFYSPAAVVPFFISQRLASLFQSQVQSVSFSGWASLVHFYNNNQKELFKKRLLELLKANLLICLMCLIIIWTLNKNFIQLWIGLEYYIDTWFTALVAILSLINILNFFIGHVLSGTGHVKTQSKAYLYTGAINLALSVALTSSFGFHGPIIASVLTMSFLLCYKIKILLKVYSISFLEIIRIFISQIFIACAFIYIIQYYIIDLYRNDWFHLILSAASISFAFMIFVFLVCFSKEERSLWGNRLKQILRI